MRTIKRPSTGTTARIVLALAFAVAITLDPGSDRAGSATLLVGNLHVGNGGAPFEGDRANFVTISPNGDGLRDSARLSFRLSRAARVTMTALVDGGRAAPPRVVSSTSFRLGAGRHRLNWTPPAEPRASDVHAAAPRRRRGRREPRRPRPGSRGGLHPGELWQGQQRAARHLYRREQADDPALPGGARRRPEHLPRLQERRALRRSGRQANAHRLVAQPEPAVVVARAGARPGQRALFRPARGG